MIFVLMVIFPAGCHWKRMETFFRTGAQVEDVWNLSLDLKPDLAVPKTEELPAVAAPEAPCELVPVPKSPQEEAQFQFCASNRLIYSKPNSKVKQLIKEPAVEVGWFWDV